MRRLRVALDARSLANPATRGMDRYLIGLAQHLGEFGIDVTLFHNRRQPIPAERRRQLPVPCVGLRDDSGIWWEQVSVPLALLRGRFDLYHSVAERVVPLFAPCPRVVTLHSMTDWSYQRLVRSGRLPGTAADYLGYEPPQSLGLAYYLACIRWGARWVITVSEFARQEIVDLFRWPAQRVLVTPLGLAAEFTRPRKTEADLKQSLAALGVSTPYMLYVGGYERHKNPHGLLAMFAEVSKLRPDLSLVMVGTGQPPPGLIAVKPARVVFLSDLRDELVDLYDASELFVSLSWRESFGLPAVEAMSRGIGVVCSTWGAMPEVAGPAGRFVDPRDPPAAARTALGFLSVPAGERAQLAQHQAARYTWRETARTTAVVYREAIL